jgi:hypothetical protein
MLAIGFDLLSRAFSSEVRPVRVKKTRQIKNPEPRFDLIETDKALASRRRGGSGCDRCSDRYIDRSTFCVLSCIGIAKTDQLRQLLGVQFIDTGAVGMLLAHRTWSAAIGSQVWF